MKFKNNAFIFLLIPLQTLFFFQVFSENKQLILKKLESLTLEEKKDLTSFFKICFCSSEFGYTIFGEKPMSTDGLLVIRPNFEDIEFKEHERVVCSYRKKEGMDVWKKHFEDMELNGFSLIFFPVPNHPEFIHFSIINHQNFLHILEENIEEFQTVLSRKITSQEILNEYKKGEGEIFNAIERHDGLLGILLGFGKENSFKFMNNEKLSPSVDPMSLKGVGMENVRLPCFMVTEGANETNKIMESFSRQREKINEIYHKENFLELVLIKLFCTD